MVGCRGSRWGLSTGTGGEATAASGHRGYKYRKSVSTPGASVWARGLFTDPKLSEDPWGLHSSLRVAFLPDSGDKPHGAWWKTSTAYPHWCLRPLATCSTHGGTGFWAGSWELAVWWVANSPGCFLVRKGDPQIKSGLDFFTSPSLEQQCDSSVVRLECHVFISLLRGIILPAIGLQNSHSEPVLNKPLEKTDSVSEHNFCCPPKRKRNETGFLITRQHPGPSRAWESP